MDYPFCKGVSALLDNLTHGLLGYAVYAASGIKGATKKERLGYAAAAVVGAEIPDIEGFTTFMGQEIYLTWHRAITHSLFFSPLMALLAVGIVALFNRSIHWGKAWLLAWVATLTHLLSDWANTWGTGLLEPFVEGRYSLGILPIVDLIILLIFACGFLMKGKYGRVRTFRGVWAALLLYVSLQAGHAAWLESRLTGVEQTTPVAQLVPTQYQLVAKDGDHFHYYAGSLFTGLRKIGESRSESHPAVEKALAADGEARALVRFLSSHGTEVEESATGYRVRFYDPRFRMQSPSLLSTQVIVPKESPKESSPPQTSDP